ncbi:MAG: nucleotidyl transferase AbiEii/AbiGii toxin family protein [Candidatus Taylorbacteria bacterium]|nr:nucleotidyl transferase AbiEii/AbiGii toxin family protein [Candidatus Taylorbacteria bacterium]
MFLHKEIITKEQSKLLPLVAEFSKGFGLVGGTAIALYLGHRRSIDFDLFSQKKFGNQSLLNKILRRWKTDQVIVNKIDELTLTISGIKFTFFCFPFEIAYTQDFEGIIKIPDLITLAAMKAFALGQRAKWKDYLDLYFIIKDHFSVGEISQKAKQLFGGNFNEKLFRGQLAYFEGINYQEQVEFMPGFEVEDEIVRDKLMELSLE